MTAVEPAEQSPAELEAVALPERPPLMLATGHDPLTPWNAGQPDRRPVLAPWLRRADERRRALTWWLGALLYRLAYHGVRVPVYVARAAMLSPAGAWRLTARWGRWISDDEHAPLRVTAAQRGATSEALALRKSKLDVIRRRARLTAVVAVPALLFVVLPLVLFAQSWALHSLGVAGVLALGVYGATPDRRVFRPAIVPHGKRVLSLGIVLRAYIASGMCTEDNPITFATPIHRDSNGYRVVIDLPYGKTAEKAMSLREPIASGLDVDERQVFLTRVRGASGSARRVDMWVCDVDPLSIPAGDSALNEAESVNLWKPWPLGKDERGNTVMLCVLWAAMLIGAIPRRGKTFVARLIGLAAALDPHVDLYIFDLKGGPDWKSFEHVAHRVFYGDRPDPDTGIHPVGALLDTVNELLAEVDRRNRKLRSLPTEICPEGKLTEELSRTKGLDLHLKVLIIDEVQRAFTNADYGKDLEAALTDLAKAGPSAGIITVAATQKPDAKSTPTGFRDQFGIRFALYVTTRDASEAVLGAGAGGEGFHAHKLPPNAPGVGLLRGTGDAAISGGTVRTGLANSVHAEAICRRGRALREKAGTLAEMALDGVQVTAVPPQYSITADLAMVLGDDQQAHSDVLCARLAERWPERYATWRPAQLHAALKPAGVESAQVWAEALDSEKRNRYGIKRGDLLAALGE